MKTEAIMHRKLSGLPVRQSTKDNMFNATDLLSAYIVKEGKEKQISKYLENKETKELISEICKDQNIPSTECYRTRRGKNGGTWMHPFLFIDFAMWLSSSFKVQCLKWIHDNLIPIRKECGDRYKEVCSALNSTGETDYRTYKREAQLLNKLVFGSIDGKRDIATEKELDMMNKLQKMDIKLINQGKKYQERIDLLHKTKNFLNEIVYE